jgi:hypothetical protein
LSGITKEKHENMEDIFQKRINLQIDIGSFRRLKELTLGRMKDG